MKRVYLPAIIGALCLLSAGGCSRPPQKYLVGAYYYHWYPRNFKAKGFLRKYLIPPQKPVLGYYDSRDPKVAEEHISWCSRYGIDFLALDWWPDRPSQNRAISEGFLKACNIRDIKFCIFYETQGLGIDRRYGTIPWTEKKIEHFLRDMETIADRFFSHPSYLKIDDRPVIFLYLTRNFQGDSESVISRLRRLLRRKGFEVFIVADEVFWKVVREGTEPGEKPERTDQPQEKRIRLFDAVTAYNIYESQRPRQAGYGSKSSFVSDVEEVYRRYKQICGEEVLFIPDIIPGFNDRGVRLSRRHYIIPRRWANDPEGGLLFSHLFNRIGLPFIDSATPLLMITSWNEWNEDTAIEPLLSAIPTRRDISGPKQSLTQGYAYSGFGKIYLEIIRDKVVAVSGRVLTGDGLPIPGENVLARREGRIIAREKTDSRGYYRLSRWKMPVGEYLIEIPKRNIERTLKVEKSRAITGVNFVIE